MMMIDSGLDHFISQLNELPLKVRNEVFIVQPTEQQTLNLITTFPRDQESLFLIFLTPKEVSIPYLTALDLQNEVKFDPDDFKNRKLKEKTNKLRSIKRYESLLIAEQTRVVKLQPPFANITKPVLKRIITWTALECGIYAKFQEQAEKYTKLASLLWLASKQSSIREFKDAFHELIVPLEWSYGAQFYIINKSQIDLLTD